MVAPPPGGGGMPPNVTPFPGAMPPPGMPPQATPMGQPFAPPGPDTVLQAITMGVAGASDEQIKELLSDMTRQEMQGLVNALAVMDPEDADRVKSLWAELLDPGPKYPQDYPRWFKRPKRPNQAVVTSRVGQDEGEYTAYRDRVQRTLEWLTFQRRGDWKKKDKNDEPWQSPALVADHNARSFLVGGIAPQFRKRPLTGAVEPDAQKCEDFLTWTRRQHERQHADAFNGPLGIDEARYLDTHGMLVTKVMMDPENEDFPFLLEVVDPVTCFAVPGGRHGLQRLTRRYTTTVGKALDAFDTDGTLANKLFKPRQNEYGRDITRSLTSQVTVEEYYDRWWMMVIVDGVKAIDAAHRYGWVPFVVTPGGWGLPLSMADPLVNGSRLSDGSTAQSTSTWYNRVVGPLYGQIIPHAQLEAIMSKYATAVRKANNPAFIRARSLMANNKPASAVTTNDGEQNIIQKDEEELTPLNLGPAPQMAQPLIADLTRAFGMTMLPMQQYGAEAGANATGNAIEQLTENGRVILTGHIKAVERHHAAVGMRLLCLMRDWGDILGEEGKRGVLHIPYRADRVNKDDYSFEMTPDVVKRAGVEVEAVMTNVALSGLLQLGNAVAIWLNNKVMSRREAIELRGNYDPQGVFDQINEEDALLDPRVRDLSILKSLYDRAGVSQHLPPGWLASKWEQLIAQAQSGPSGSGGPRPPGGGGNPNTSATNMAALGQGPGSAGNVVGRPPGGGGPPPGMMPPGPPTEPQPPPPGLG